MKSFKGPAKEPRKRLTKRRRVFLSVGVALSVVSVVVVGGIAYQALSQNDAGPPVAASPEPSDTPEPFPTPASIGPVALKDDWASSDIFDWWEAETSSSSVVFLASDDAHDGAYSLKVKSTLPADSGESPRISQYHTVSPGSTLTVGFWAKSTGVDKGALQIAVDVDGAVRIPVPAGEYDWTYVSKDISLPAGQGAFNIRVLAVGPINGVMIDSLTVTPVGSTEQILRNDGFESNSAELTVVNSTMMFEVDTGALEVATRRSPSGWMHWQVSEIDGKVAAEGDVLIEDYKGTVDLSLLPVGMYSVSLQAHLGEKQIDRSTTFSVLDPIEVTNAAESPYGVFLHLLGGEPRLTNLVDTLAFSGISHARVEMTWQAIEQTKGVYTYIDPIESTLRKFGEVGIDPLMVPGYTSGFYDGGLTPSSRQGLTGYANLTNDIASHYADLGQDFEIYNEFDHVANSGACGKTPECYLDMLSKTATTVKESNPDAVIVAPGNAGMGVKMDWLSEFIALGGLDYTDVVSAHPYVQPAAPEVLIGDLDKLGQMVRDANGGQPKPIWLTEMGWASVPDWVSKQQQADYTVRMMAIALGHGVDRVYWFEAASLNLQEDQIETNFGLFEPPSSLLPYTNAPKAAGMAQAVLARELGNKKFAGIDPTAEGAYSYAFGEGDASMRIMWATTTGQSVEITAKKPITVVDQLGRQSTHKPVKGKVTLELGESPVYVTGTISALASSVK